jgi:type VI secretion system protein ImpA
MFKPESVEALLAPIEGSSPCGDDLEYDPAFTALVAQAQGKPEQQFGDTVIPAVEPEWPAVADQAEALLRRTKDVRLAVLLTRAVTHEQGLEGLLLGLQLMTGLLDRYWPTVYPLLDADDGDDPTMRMNAFAPLADAPLAGETLLLLDLYDTQVGVARSSGPLRVRQIVVAHGALAAASGEALSQTQVAGALAEIQAARPGLASMLAGLAPRVAELQKVVGERSGRADLLNLGRLSAIGRLLAQIARSLDQGEAALETDAAATVVQENGAAAPAPAAAVRGDGRIASRQDALRMLDQVIGYFEQAEPGNPAPLLLKRAKQLVGVSFMDIISNLAPDALKEIKNLAGPEPADD